MQPVALRLVVTAAVALALTAASCARAIRQVEVTPGQPATIAELWQDIVSRAASGLAPRERTVEGEQPDSVPLRPFRILGVQQIAVGGEDKLRMRHLWVDLLGLSLVGQFTSEREKC